MAKARILRRSREHGYARPETIAVVFLADYPNPIRVPGRLQERFEPPMNVDNMFAQHTPTPAQKRRINSLRNCARTLAREIRRSTPAGPDQTLAIRHVEDALMRANLAILEDREDTAERSWTVYFDLEDSGTYVVQDGELFREEPGGTYTPVGRVRK